MVKLFSVRITSSERSNVDGKVSGIEDVGKRKVAVDLVLSEESDLEESVQLRVRAKPWGRFGKVLWGFREGSGGGLFGCWGATEEWLVWS